MPLFPKRVRTLALSSILICGIGASTANAGVQPFLELKWWVDGNLVFRSEDGQPSHPDRFTRRFKRLVSDAGLPALRGPHNLRHTWATLALEAGIHPKVVSERLGHATIAITLDTYSHVVPSLDADAANLVADRILGGTSDG